MIRYLKTILKWLLAATGIYLFEFATGWVRAFDEVGIDIPIMFSKYFLLVAWLIYKKKISIRNACLLFSFTIASIPITAMIVDNVPPSSISAYLNNAMGILGTWAACIAMSKTRKVFKWIIPALAAIFSTWFIGGGGMDHYYSLVNGHTFTGKIEPRDVGLNWKVYNKNNDTFTGNDYKGKIVYFDFWTTNCGACFIKFPQLEKLYQQYQHDNRVFIQAVNIPIERDTAGKAFYMIGRSGKYTFPVVIGSESMRKAFGIEAYPAVVILKDNKMVFRGRTELAEDALEDILKASIMTR